MTVLVVFMTRFFWLFRILEFYLCNKCCHCDYLVGFIHRGLGARFVVFGSFLGCLLCVEVSVKVN